MRIQNRNGHVIEELHKLIERQRGDVETNENAAKRLKTTSKRSEMVPETIQKDGKNNRK